MNMKNLAMWAVIVFLTVGLYNMFKNPQANIQNSNTIIFSEFLSAVDNGEVVKVKSANPITEAGSVFGKDRSLNRTFSLRA